MTLNEVRIALDADVVNCENKLEREVKSACGADLMSDVLAYSKEKVLLLTGLVNPQVIRTAEMMDILAIMFVRGKEPTPDMAELATQKSIVLLTTKHPMYIACGILYSKGLGGDKRKDEDSL